MSTLYYLGAPYTSPDQQVVNSRVDAIDTFLSHALLTGADVFSPITYGHLMCLRFDLPRSWDFWKRFDLEMLRRSDCFLILALDGWEKSVGLQAEIECAIDLSIPREYIEPQNAMKWKPTAIEQHRSCGYSMSPCSECGKLTSNHVGLQFVCWECVRNRDVLVKGGY